METKIVVVIICAAVASLAVPILAGLLARFGLFPPFGLAVFSWAFDFRPADKKIVSSSGGSVFTSDFASDGRPIAHVQSLVPVTLVVVTLLATSAPVITETYQVMHHHAIDGG